MPSNKEAKRTLYYCRQASACAVAAATAAHPETKQAYLELEQAWLCLAPKAETSPSDRRFALAQHQTEPASDLDGDASHALTDAAPDGATPVSFRSTDTQNFTDRQNGFARVRAK